ncbi:universal stress protein [Zobellia galactanivorans]|uniref:universal stress protein n=1 Tax=Zobellia galactanivorans (strain DSM 12802 / CCUG 47099 / CIP 106680 / NCIMB 13871 / Dsij) TaxID=63186 RepID=UPI001C073276|nr:universal stress protein [Zobellia galactanivorans]MBU3026239.1 universal stress protein [Zobellia galactanivorans]
MLKIVLPTDFSANAQNAIDYALFLFENEECTFYLLHAYHDVPSAPGTKLDAIKNLERLTQHTERKNNNTKHRFQTIFETDSVLNLINRTAIDNAVDYIFMGSKGYSTLHEVFLGSNTVDVLKYLAHPCAVIAVPEDYDYDLPDTITLASDYKHTFTPSEVAPLIAISKLWNTTVSIAHIHTEKELSDEQKANKSVLKHILNEVDTNFIELEMKNSVASTLLFLEKENPNIGMVSLLNTKHGFFQKLLREPILRNTCFQTRVPLLVLPQIAP